MIVAVPQAEVGQGVYTSLPQILADELGADWRTIGVEPAPLSPLYANVLLAEEASARARFPSAFGIDHWAARQYAMRNAVMLTGGSSSVRGFEARLREAGAGARALLSMAAAARWGANWEELDTAGGFVMHGQQRLAFAELAEEAAALELPENLPVRGGNQNRLVGQSLPRLDLPAKIDGIGDVRGRRAAAGHGLCRGAHDAAGRAPDRRSIGTPGDAVPGASRMLENPDWIAVAAVNSWAAAKALDALRPAL